MLKFKQKPDDVLTEVITRAINVVITELSQDVSMYDYKTEFVNEYFTKQDQMMLGGTKQLLYELKRIKMAHESKDVYMPSDLHFLILDRILSKWCTIYSSDVKIIMEDNYDYPVMYKGKPVTHFDVNDIIDLFFWNNNYTYYTQKMSKPLGDKYLSFVNVTKETSDEWYNDNNITWEGL